MEAPCRHLHLHPRPHLHLHLRPRSTCTTCTICAGAILGTEWTRNQNQDRSIEPGLVSLRGLGACSPACCCCQPSRMQTRAGLELEPFTCRRDRPSWRGAPRNRPRGKPGVWPGLASTCWGGRRRLRCTMSWLYMGAGMPVGAHWLDRGPAGGCSHGKCRNVQRTLLP